MVRQTDEARGGQSDRQAGRNAVVVAEDEEEGGEEQPPEGMMCWKKDGWMDGWMEGRKGSKEARSLEGSLCLPSFMSLSLPLSHSLSISLCCTVHTVQSPLFDGQSHVTALFKMRSLLLRSCGATICIKAYHSMHPRLLSHLATHFALTLPSLCTLARSVSMLRLFYYCGLFVLCILVYFLPNLL